MSKDQAIIKSEKTEINRNPSHEEVAKNISMVIEIMSEGHTDPLAIHKELEKRDVYWSRSKVQGYIRASSVWIDKVANDLKKVVDQRHILVKKAESVEAATWAAIKSLRRVREEAQEKLTNGQTIESLTLTEQQVLKVDPHKLMGIESKAMSVILKAQERQSELYGYKNDKTILIQHEKGDKLKYEDNYNEELISRYRNISKADDEVVIDAEIIEETVRDDETGLEIIEALARDIEGLNE